MVAVNVWYHVGSKNERPGRTGFAHLFEHLMFEGSQHYDRGYFQPLQQAGGLLNGSTNTDRTNYWEVVPTGALELALWMESDRMGYLLPALTREKFENQRDVVLNERRQNYENRPYGLAGHRDLGGAVSAGSSLPLGDDRIGRRSARDVARRRPRVLRHLLPSGQRLAGARRRHRCRRRLRSRRAVLRRYPAGSEAAAGAAHAVPANAASAAAVRGSRRAAAALSGVAFGGDVRGRRCRARPRLRSDRRTARPRGCIDRSSTTEQIAADVVAYQHSREMSGVFQIAATAAPGVALGDLEERHSRDGRRARRQRPDRRTSSSARTRRPTPQFVYRVQTIGGFGGKSDQLNAYNVFQGDPGYFARDRARYELGHIGRHSVGRAALACRSAARRR